MPTSPANLPGLAEQVHTSSPCAVPGCEPTPHDGLSCGDVEALLAEATSEVARLRNLESAYVRDLALLTERLERAQEEKRQAVIEVAESRG